MSGPATRSTRHPRPQQGAVPRSPHAARRARPETRPHQRHDAAQPLPPIADDAGDYDEQLVRVRPDADTGRRSGYDTSMSISEIYPRHRRRRSRACIGTVSAFCLVGVATLVVPVAIFLLPYIRTSLFVSATQTDPGTQPAGESLTSPSVSPLTNKVTAALATATKLTESTAPTTPDPCQAPSPDVPNAENLTSVAHYYRLDNFSDPARPRQAIYCIYNVSRFRRPNGYGYVVQDLPMALCPAIVYWSWKLSGGTLTSRAKEFDNRYGLTVIRQSAHYENAKVDVILTVGGFREDSADFHKVQHDEITQHRLIQSVYTISKQYSLAGINLHWIPNDESCERLLGGRAPHLHEFVMRLRALLAINGRSKWFSVTAMVDPRDRSQMEFFRVLANQLNLTFFRTHDLAPLSDFDQYCGNSLPRFRSYLQALTPFFHHNVSSSATPAAPPPHRNKLCISMSLALYARQGYTMDLPSPPQSVSGTPGYIALFEVCDSKLNFREKARHIPGCVVRRTAGVLLELAYAFEDTSTLSAKMSTLGPKNESCVLLHDLDFDNYRRRCYHSTQYLMLLYFYDARKKHSTMNISQYLH
ncbi:hypothetical protein HPB49_009913 [Dermacentor silvarum]|uniref:Uncharacterized protein n=1 Tax=Dermacentor silvarum TaxID=543639 RepID=A0ACB8D4J6_DERSI|nr:hypothetical protein HPB49_009913 [Dermacentor silvarum]